MDCHVSPPTYNSSKTGPVLLVLPRGAGDGEESGNARPMQDVLHQVP